ncbi:MAG: hypothetical protein KF846_03495 [Cyclobacteriaceae bacterium]|nr:hypothetical protein [Cyclobacteriaceae bacterium]
MEAIRKKKIKRIGKQVIIDLPDDFKAEEVDAILWPSGEDVENKSTPAEIEVWRKDLKEFYSQFNVDLSQFKFNRDELYDRP